MPLLDARRSALATFAVDLRVFGPASFLYSDVDALFAYGPSAPAAHRAGRTAGALVFATRVWVGYGRH